MRHKVREAFATNELQMTARARAYLLIGGSRHVVVGVMCILLPGGFSSTNYAQILQFLAPLPMVQTLTVWGLVFIISGLLFYVATFTQRENHARLALIVSVVVTMMWAGGFIAAAFHNQLSSPLGPVPWFALAAKDLVVCAQPLRSPFEPLIRRFLERRVDAEQ